MLKKDRHTAILQLIEEQKIYTQEELTSALINKGYDVSQSTVSRDINELNLAKVDTHSEKSYYIRALSAGNQLSPERISLLKHITVSVDYANNLIVVKTLSGNAGSAGMIIDELNFPQVLGCVAGDDVVIIVAKTNADAEVVSKSLRNI